MYAETFKMGRRCGKSAMALEFWTKIEDERYDMNKKDMNAVSEMIWKAIYQERREQSMSGCAVQKDACATEHPESIARRVVAQKADRKQKLIAAYSALRALSGPFAGIMEWLPEGTQNRSPIGAAIDDIQRELGALELG
jgi:hypothetical protein